MSPSQSSTLNLETISSGSERGKNSKHSMLYSVLPAVLQSHLPALPSLRRSMIDLRGRSAQTKSGLTIADISTPESPPPEYTSRAGSATPPAQEYLARLTESEYSDCRGYESERPCSSSSSVRTLPPPFSSSETETGINWKYANQGISLLTQAYQESSAVASDADDVSAVLTRQLYLHGISYLLRGIPTDLTQEETLSVHAAVPPSILELQNNAANHAVVPFNTNTAVSQERSKQHPSVLHRLTAALVFQTFVMIQFLLPYIRLLIGHAYRWEQEHRVTRKIFNKSITTADELGRRTVQLSQRVCQINDGKVGQAINDVTIWWVRGLTGGLQQGVSEGVIFMGNERSQSVKGKQEENLH